MQVRAGGEHGIVQRDLVDDGHLGALQALDDLVVIGVRVADQIVEDGLQRGQVEIALIERCKIEEYGAATGHGLYSYEAWGGPSAELEWGQICTGWNFSR